MTADSNSYVANVIINAGKILQEACHGSASNAGWWDEYRSMPEEYRKYFLATKLSLVHSEASEALEGLRKGKMDEHLPHRPAGEVELADLLIRVFDFGGAMGWDLGSAIAEKMAYNATRADHKPEARAASGGKSF